MKIDRLFAITNILINKKNVTAAELAEKFDVSIRTIYRDIDILSTNGIPIYTLQGKGGGISIVDSYSIDKALLSDDEQKQILMALESVKATGQEDVEGSICKLGGLFNKNSSNWIEIDFSAWEQSDKDKDYFRIIKSSILNSKVINISYINTKGEKSNRLLEPLKLIFKWHSWYLYGYCKVKEDYRFFKLSRITSLEECNSNFNKEVPSIINKSYEAKEEEEVKLVVKISGSMSFRVYDEFRHGEIINDDEGFIVKAIVPKGRWLLSYLLSFGKDIEIIEPLEIRNEFKELLNEIIKKYYL